MYYSVQTFGISICWIVVLVSAQLNQPQQRQYKFNGYRRFNNGGGNSGFGAASSLSPGVGDFIKFPDEGSVNTATVNLIRSDNNENNSNGRHKNNADTDSIMVSDEQYNSHGQSGAQQKESCTSHCMSLNVSRELSSYDDYYNLLEDGSRDQFVLIAPRFAGGDVERSQVSRPIPANCIPEMTVVPLQLSDESDMNDPSIFVFPSCTRVKRCGGCCGSHLLSCQPVEKTTTKYQVLKSQYLANGRTKFLGREVVEVEEHSLCKCDCKKKESDCSKYQRYDKGSCNCVCTNFEDQKKCSDSKVDKVWEEDTCTCKCPEELRCSTDTYFDQNTCSCVETPGHRHTQMVERRRLITKPVIYVPQTPQTYYASDPAIDPNTN